MVWGHQGLGISVSNTASRYGPGGYGAGNYKPFLPASSTGGEAYNYILFQNNNFIGMTAGTLNGGNGYINPAGPNPTPPHLANWNNQPMNTQAWCVSCKSAK